MPPQEEGATDARRGDAGPRSSAEARGGRRLAGLAFGVVFVALVEELRREPWQITVVRQDLEYEVRHGVISQVEGARIFVAPGGPCAG
jgi:hypothetical protein